MPRSKQGAKANRRERHLAFTAELKARKRLRKQRAAKFAHLPGQQPPMRPVATKPGKAPAPALTDMNVSRLREIARDRGCDVRSRHRKADLIAMIQQAQT